MINRLNRLAVLAFALAATPLLAAPADDIKSRVTGLRELGAAFKSVRDGLRGPEVQTILIQQAAKQIRQAATQQYRWFPAGSGPESGAKTAAKAEIWSQPAKFKAAQDAFATEAGAFYKAAASADAETIKAASAKLGATCKSCHDNFRVPEQH